MTLSPAAKETLLAFADDEHMVGARHTSWIGLGPFLEEDLTFCSIAQDELGHAIALYERLLETPSPTTVGLQDDRTLDGFALLRDASEYRSCWLAEAECSDWSDALVRHWLYDTAEQLRWEALQESVDETLRHLAIRAEREEAFHRLHAGQFMDRMTSSNDEARERVASSVARLMPLAYGIWDPVAGEAEALAEGIITASSEQLGRRWADLTHTDLDRWGLDAASPSGNPSSATSSSASQQQRTLRSNGFDSFLHGLQDVISIDPSAIW